MPSRLPRAKCHHLNRDIVSSRTGIEPGNDDTDTAATTSIDGLFYLSVLEHARQRSGWLRDHRDTQNPAHHIGARWIEHHSRVLDRGEVVDQAESGLTVGLMGVAGVTWVAIGLARKGHPEPSRYGDPP